MEEFLQNEIDQARVKFSKNKILPLLKKLQKKNKKYKNEFRKAKISYDAAHSKLLTATKKENIDPINLFSLHQEYHYCKRKFQRLFLEASNRLEDVVFSKDFKMVELVIAFLEKQSIFYEKCSQLVESQEEKINSLRQSSEQKRIAFFENVNLRHEKRELKKQENEDSKYDQLVNLFSSAQLHVVNAICLSAGRDFF